MEQLVGQGVHHRSRIILPGRERDAEGGGEFTGVEPGVVRPAGRGRVGGRWNRLYGLGLDTQRQATVAGPLQDEPRKAVPRGVATGHGVVDARLGGRTGPRRAVDQPGRHVGQERGGRRCAGLVVDYPQLVPLAGQAQDRAHEVGAMHAVDPAGAEHVVAAGGGGGLLAGQLGGSVDAQRRGDVGLDVGAGLRAVEDVVGGIVDQQCPAPRDRGGEGGHGVGVDQPGAVGLRLGPVDGRVGGGVDDDVGRLAIHQRGQLGGPLEVDLRVVEGGHASQGRQRAAQLVPHLAVLAQQQDLEAHDA